MGLISYLSHQNPKKTILNTRLADDLRALIPPPNQTHTLQSLLDQMGDRGILLMMVLLNIPFSLPIPIPGLSTPFGLALLFLCTKVAWGIPQKLPLFLGNKKISQNILKAILEKCIWGVEKIEKYLRPRFLLFCDSLFFRGFNLFICFIMAFILTLPLAVPLTNSFPALTLIFLSLGMMEKDGLVVFIGYIFTFITAVFFYLLYTIGVVIFDWIRIPATNFFHQIFS